MPAGLFTFRSAYTTVKLLPTLVLSSSCPGAIQSKGSSVAVLVLDITGSREKGVLHNFEA